MVGHSLFDLSGKRGYVTGGGSGLGRAIALGLAEAGAAVVVSDINLPAAEAVAKEIQAQGGRGLALRTDVIRKSEVEELLRVTTEHLGGLDFAFNNAGMLKIVKPEDLSEEDWQTELNVDLTGVFLCCQAAGRYMIAHGGGKIINTASISGMIVNSGLTYSTAKAGVIQLTRVLALRWAKHKVFVNCFSPGYVRTNMTAPHLTRPEVEQEMLRQTPLRRLGEARDVVGPALFLASPASDFVTGHNLVVDGGVTLA
ncbi:MAG TPA: SDR family NAD(P)-dependent oxidoreductase [Candidatus Binatia bacterium]|nr:SDR family NAD(P)-dependent oxidoreductase [Candidatus Binatia bacterium]